MNKLKARSKIYFQDKNNFFYIKKKDLRRKNKRKWFILKRKKKYIESIPENRKDFFKKRLLEKQKVKFFYGCLPEYKFKKNLLLFYENQLSIILVRSKKVKSIFHAKQLINHKKVKINNKKINKANYILKEGDIINIIK